MKYMNKLFIVSASVALLLSACGTNEDSAQPKSNDQAENVQQDTASKSDQTSGAAKKSRKKMRILLRSQPNLQEVNHRLAKRRKVDSQGLLQKQN